MGAGGKEHRFIHTNCKPSCCLLIMQVSASTYQDSDTLTSPRGFSVMKLEKVCVSLLGNVLTHLPVCARVLFQVLCNGPGTCVPLCAAGLLLGILGMKKVLIVYVESICRVQTLSLTGKILYPISDYFFVQWPALLDKYPKSIFLGRIV